ncbi:MAG TPA: glycoside hydrolase family 3 protein [Steroidobacteraceae bacterium]|jgi:beta-glucosidase
MKPKKSVARRLLCGIIPLTLLAMAGAADADPAMWPQLKSPVSDAGGVESRIEQMIGRMTLEQKVAQMVQADIRYITPDDVRRYRLGSILNGGGAFPGDNKHAAVADWVALADRYYDASMDTSTGAQAIPILWGTDAVHGHNNVFRATVFPHNIALGAAHDPDLIERIGAATAAEVASTGIDWTFAPTLAVVRDARWGRTYESYSDQPDIVREYAGRMVQGLQGQPGSPHFLEPGRVLATAKHFLGDGGTTSGIDRGDNASSEGDLFKVHAQGYIAALGAGVQTIMVSYSSWRGLKMHGQHYLLTDVLKTRLGFDGIVVSDWDGIDEVQSCAKDRCAQALNAGIDLFMVPELWKSFIENTCAQVRAGDVPISRIDDAVRRILRVKIRAGLFERGRPSSRPFARKSNLVGAPEHRQLAEQAVRESLVLLKNARDILPLKRKLKVLVAGDGADNIGKQTGGWTLTWQGTGNINADFPGATSIYGGIRAAVTGAGGTATLSPDGTYKSRPDVAIVVFGEDPYAEWHGDIRSVDYRPSDTRSEIDMSRPPAETPAPGAWREPRLADHPAANDAAGRRSDVDLDLLQRLHAKRIPVVAVFLSGRPRGVSAEIDAADAFVAAWLPGSEGEGVADVLFRKPDGSVNFDFTGKLSFAWPNGQDASTGAASGVLFPDGFGLKYCKGGCGAPLSGKLWPTAPSPTSPRTPASP